MFPVYSHFYFSKKCDVGTKKKKNHTNINIEMDKRITKSYRYIFFLSTINKLLSASGKSPLFLWSRYDVNINNSGKG